MICWYRYQDCLLIKLRKWSLTSANCNMTRLHYPSTEVVERVDSYSYLGVKISNQLDWSWNTKCIQKKCCQQNYFVRKLRKCYVCRTINYLFYKSTVQSVLCYCLISWGGSLSVKNRVLLNRIVRSASKTIGTALPTVNELYWNMWWKRQGKS